ncbi:MAG: Rieske 2Fe-2S domain-containing protein [Candidatus Latescibacterota bacterium]|nr:MAG: Rieske 2Fe-2S domain-containing protein [Candidatus Latescibacterota bacterium]
MTQKGIKRNILQRVFGIPSTAIIDDSSAWSVEGNTIVVDLDRVPQLGEPGSGVRIESRELSERILVIHGNDDAFHAFRNRCGHGGRRLDPVPDDTTIQCCSIGKTTCDYTGRVLSGPAKSPVVVYRVESGSGKLVTYLD